MVKELSLNVWQKFKNLSSQLVVFVVVPFNKISLFSKDLITFIISFISLFFSIILEPVIDENYFLIILLSPESTRIPLFNFSISVLFNSFINEGRVA